MHLRSAFVRMAAVLLVIAKAAWGQPCVPHWSSAFDHAELDGPVYAIALFDDDGAGPHPPALYIGGSFTIAGVTPVSGIAKWDGTRWVPVGGGMASVGASGPQVNALLVFNDGVHPSRLVASGYFTDAGGVAANNIAAWDGSEWSSLGAGVGDDSHGVMVLAAYDDDGPGPGAIHLFAGGQSGLARWDGAAWSPVAGLTQNGSLAGVSSLLAADIGQGPSLYVSGLFNAAGGNPANAIARWNGAAWFPLGAGLSPAIGADDIVVYDDDGPGPHHAALVVTNGARVRQWDGGSWTLLGELTSSGGCCPFGSTLAVWDDDGVGPHLPALYVGGEFFQAGGTDAWNIARWDGTSWSAVGNTNTGEVGGGDVWKIVPEDDGFTHGLVVGGAFRRSSTAAGDSIVAWSGTSWSGFGAVGGADNGVTSVAVFDDDGPGAHPPVLVVGGGFASAGGVPAQSLAQWDGSRWSPLGLGLGPEGITETDVEAMAVVSGMDALAGGLYVGGDFYSAGGVTCHNIARWDGAAWSNLGLGLAPGGGQGSVFAIAPFQQNGVWNLAVGGRFPNAGGTPAVSIARWDGSEWSPMGSGMTTGVPPESDWGWVNAIAQFDDDGQGPHHLALYAGGIFDYADGIPASNIAKWDGTSWSAVGGGVGGYVTAMVTWDEDGPGPQPAHLFLGGLGLSLPNSTDPVSLARWDGGSWTSVPGLYGDVYALAVFDDGTGLALYATGFVSVDAGGNGVLLAKWNGTSWTAVGGGVTAPGLNWATALSAGPGPLGLAIHIGGYFTSAGGLPSERIGAWVGCPPCYANCDGSTIPPMLNINDFVCFMNKYAAGDRYANCDGSNAPPVLNINDFQCFLNAYAVGCR